MQSQPIQAKSSKADLVMRPAQREDRAALEAIAAQIWEGNDYLPHVLESWFSDPYGGLYVAVLNERVIGVSKITRLAEDEWWLEGLRVDPAFQGQGFARIIHHYMINLVRQRGSGVVRFSTSSENEAIHQLAAETGFRQVGTFIFYTAGPLDEPVQALWPLKPDDAPRVRAWLDASPHFAQAQRSLEWDWCFFLLTDQRLAERLAAGVVYGWPEQGDRGRLAGVLMLNPSEPRRWPGEPGLNLAYLDSVLSERTALARDVRRLAAALGREEVEIRETAQPEYIAALEDAGFARGWDGEEWLYARDVVLTQHASVRVEHPPAD